MFVYNRKSSSREPLLDPDCIILNNRRIQSTSLFNNKKFLLKTDPPPNNTNNTFQLYYNNLNKQQQQQQQQYQEGNLHSGNSSSSSFEGSSSFHSLSSNSISSLSKTAACSINVEKCFQHEPCRSLDYNNYCMRRDSTDKLMDFLTETSSSSSSSHNSKPDNDHMCATTVKIKINYFFIVACVRIIHYNNKCIMAFLFLEITIS